MIIGEEFLVMANYHCNYISESSPFQAIGAYTREACISLLLDQYSVIIRHLFCFCFYQFIYFLFIQRIELKA